MSFRAKRELLVQVAPRYRAARHGERSAILDEFIGVTRYHRKEEISAPPGQIHPPADPATATGLLRPRSPGSASQRVVGGQWNLRQAPGAVSGRVDPNTRAS